MRFHLLLSSPTPSQCTCDNLKNTFQFHLYPILASLTTVFSTYDWSHLSRSWNLHGVYQSALAWTWGFLRMNCLKSSLSWQTKYFSWVFLTLHRGVKAFLLTIFVSFMNIVRAGSRGIKGIRKVGAQNVAGVSSDRARASRDWS